MSRPDFREWLREYRRENSSLGDLARIVVTDNRWPTTEDQLDYRMRLARLGASAITMDTLTEAWRTYRREPIEAAPCVHPSIGEHKRGEHGGQAVTPPEVTRPHTDPSKIGDTPWNTPVIGQAMESPNG